jgi:hypothetical protein
MVVSDGSQRYDKVGQSYEIFGVFTDNEESACDPIWHFKDSVIYRTDQLCVQRCILVPLKTDIMTGNTKKSL